MSSPRRIHDSATWISASVRWLAWRGEQQISWLGYAGPWSKPLIHTLRSWVCQRDHTSRLTHFVWCVNQSYCRLSDLKEQSYQTFCLRRMSCPWRSMREHCCLGSATWRKQRTRRPGKLKPSSSNVTDFARPKRKSTLVTRIRTCLLCLCFICHCCC